MHNDLLRRKRMVALYQSKLKLELSNVTRIYDESLAEERGIAVEIQRVRNSIQATNLMVKRCSDPSNVTYSDTLINIFRYIEFNEEELHVYESQFKESRKRTSEVHQRLIEIKLKLKKFGEHMHDLGASIEKIVEFSEQRDMDEAYLARRSYFK